MLCRPRFTIDDRAVDNLDVKEFSLLGGFGDVVFGARFWAVGVLFRVSGCGWLSSLNLLRQF